MSYNIYHGEHAYRTGESNLMDVANLISQIKPDFVALQEVDSLTGRSSGINGGVPLDLMEWLEEQTGMVGYFGKAIDYDGGGYGEGILAKKTLQTRKVMLPTPKGGESRALFYVVAETESDVSFIFAGTHLCHQFTENRLAQIRAINDRLLDKKWPVLLAGDFNFTPHSPAYAFMEEQWFDAARIVDREPQLTFSYANPSKRIDYVFLSASSNWKVLDVQTVKVDYSDHLPVIATVVLNP